MCTEINRYIIHGVDLVRRPIAGVVKTNLASVSKSKLKSLVENEYDNQVISLLKNLEQEIIFDHSKTHTFAGLATRLYELGLPSGDVAIHM